MIDNLLNSMPRWMLAGLAILIGFVVIVANDPPHTVCDSQLELFKQEQADFLYGQGRTPPLIKHQLSNCEDSAGPGGCYELISRLKKLNQDLDLIPHQCSETFGKEDDLKGFILRSMKLMVQISWGDRGPASEYKRSSWMDTSDLAVFCGLRKHAEQFYGVDALDGWREGVLGSLPEADKMDHESLYSKSLFATPCEAFR